MLALALFLASAAGLASLDLYAQSSVSPGKDTLEKKRAVTGVVVDGVGKPIARAPLFLIGVNDDGEPELVRAQPDGYSDDQGRFSLAPEGRDVQSGQHLSLGLQRASDKEVKTLRLPSGDFPRIETWRIPAASSLDLGLLTPTPERKWPQNAEGKLVEILMMQSANIGFRSTAGPARATYTGKPQRVFVVQVGDRRYGGKCTFGSKSPYRASDWKAGEDVTVRFDPKGTRFWLKNRHGRSTLSCPVDFEEKVKTADAVK